MGGHAFLQLGSNTLLWYRDLGDLIRVKKKRWTAMTTVPMTREKGDLE